MTQPKQEPEEKEIRRRIVLYVTEYIRLKDDEQPVMFHHPPPLRYSRWELPKSEAIKMRDDINAQLESNMPGTISVTAKGHLTI